MWRLTPIDPKEFITELPQKNGDAGEVTQFLSLLANSPVSLKAFLQAKKTLATGMLTASQREEISLLVAEINGSKDCLAAHELAARKTGMSDQEIRAARKMESKDPPTEAMLRFVQAVVLQRGVIKDDDFCAVRNAGFSDAQIIEILAHVVLNIFSNYFNLLAQTDMDQFLSRNVWKSGPAVNTAGENNMSTALL